MKALYIHIPFCTKVCTYCDFYKMVARDSWKEKYVEYLIKELDYRKDMLGEIKTIYIGGGTPSSLKHELLEKLFIALKEAINFDNIVEFTIEANPDDINQNLLAILTKYGVNRISLGIQSLNKKKLKKLGRSHSKKNIKKAFKLIKASGITNINADLIYGVEKESFAKIKKDIKSVIRWKATHISTYSLIIEEKTILNKMIKEGNFKPIAEDNDYNLYKKICALLNKKHFEHYEISNFALPNCQSIHNLTYWNNENYLGLGAGASYYIGNIRYTNIMNLESYFKGLDENHLSLLEVTELTKEEQMSEEVILGLRKLTGININDFQTKYEQSIYTVYPFINEKIANKELELEGDYLRVVADKLYLMNEILVDFV